MKKTEVRIEQGGSGMLRAVAVQEGEPDIILGHLHPFIAEAPGILDKWSEMIHEAIRHGMAKEAERQRAMERN